MEIIIFSCQLEHGHLHKTLAAQHLEEATQNLWTVLVCMCEQVRGESDVGMPFHLGLLSIRFHLRKPTWFSGYKEF